MYIRLVVSSKYDLKFSKGTKTSVSLFLGIKLVFFPKSSLLFNFSCNWFGSLHAAVVVLLIHLFGFVRGIVDHSSNYFNFVVFDVFYI